MMITSKRERVSAEAILQILEEPSGTIQAIKISCFGFKLRTSTQSVPDIISSLRPDLLTTDFKVCRPQESPITQKTSRDLAVPAIPAQLTEWLVSRSETGTESAAALINPPTTMSLSVFVFLSFCLSFFLSFFLLVFLSF